MSIEIVSPADFTKYKPETIKYLRSLAKKKARDESASLYAAQNQVAAEFSNAKSWSDMIERCWTLIDEGTQSPKLIQRTSKNLITVLQLNFLFDLSLEDDTNDLDSSFSIRVHLKLDDESLTPTHVLELGLGDGDGSNGKLDAGRLAELKAVAKKAPNHLIAACRWAVEEEQSIMDWADDYDLIESDYLRAKFFVEHDISEEDDEIFRFDVSISGLSVSVYKLKDDRIALVKFEPKGDEGLGLNGSPTTSYFQTVIATRSEWGMLLEGLHGKYSTPARDINALHDMLHFMHSYRPHC
ncbi:hypothetical protein [Marinobacter sp.]|uniref:hypothetical protein n=1 Tax=Marinobacter sp. TaxID=50741 RepID=UPI003A936546